jgi:VDE lipocalin domain
VCTYQLQAAALSPRPSSCRCELGLRCCYMCWPQPSRCAVRTSARLCRHHVHLWPEPLHVNLCHITSFQIPALTPIHTPMLQVPPECARDKNFDLSKFTGRWYITAGLNPLFDTFPCQEHFFGVPEPGEHVLIDHSDIADTLHYCAVPTCCARTLHGHRVCSLAACVPWLCSLAAALLVDASMTHH